MVMGYNVERVCEECGLLSLRINRAKIDCPRISSCRSIIQEVIIKVILLRFVCLKQVQQRKRQYKMFSEDERTWWNQNVYTKLCLERKLFEN